MRNCSFASAIFLVPMFGVMIDIPPTINPPCCSSRMRSTEKMHNKTKGDRRGWPSGSRWSPYRNVGQPRANSPVAERGSGEGSLVGGNDAQPCETGDKDEGGVEGLGGDRYWRFRGWGSAAVCVAIAHPGRTWHGRKGGMWGCSPRTTKGRVSHQGQGWGRPQMVVTPQQAP